MLEVVMMVDDTVIGEAYRSMGKRIFVNGALDIKVLADEAPRDGAHLVQFKLDDQLYDMLVQAHNNANTYGRVSQVTPTEIAPKVVPTPFFDASGGGSRTDEE